jgi:hypothetical protein
MWIFLKNVRTHSKSHMHIFNVSLTTVQILKNVNLKVWEELITQGRYWIWRCLLTHQMHFVQPVQNLSVNCKQFRVKKIFFLNHVLFFFFFFITVPLSNTWCNDPALLEKLKLFWSIIWVDNALQQINTESNQSTDWRNWPTKKISQQINTSVLPNRAHVEKQSD